jgi:serine/threonine-protein kinase
MPDLTGKSLEQAKELLYGVGVVIAGVEEVPSTEAAVGDVLRTSVEPGTELRNGGEVTLFVGASTVVVPDWTGLTRERVTEAAAALALEVTFVEEESEAPAGTVVGQTPGAGEAVGSSGITVTVAKAFEAARAVVPDVVGLLPNEGQNALAQAGFRDIRTVVIKNAEVTSEQVTQVVPGEGEEAALEAPLVLIVSQPQ